MNLPLAHGRVRASGRESLTISGPAPAGPTSDAGGLFAAYPRGVSG